MDIFHEIMAVEEHKVISMKLMMDILILTVEVGHYFPNRYIPTVMLYIIEGTALL